MSAVHSAQKIPVAAANISSGSQSSWQLSCVCARTRVSLCDRSRSKRASSPRAGEGAHIPVRFLERRREGSDLVLGFALREDKYTVTTNMRSSHWRPGPGVSWRDRSILPRSCRTGTNTDQTVLLRRTHVRLCDQERQHLSKYTWCPSYEYSSAAPSPPPPHLSLFSSLSPS